MAMVFCLLWPEIWPFFFGLMNTCSAFAMDLGISVLFVYSWQVVGVSSAVIDFIVEVFDFSLETEQTCFVEGFGSNTQLGKCFHSGFCW
jgi:hypothetical protein